MSLLVNRIVPEVRNAVGVGAVPVLQLAPLRLPHVASPRALVTGQAERGYVAARLELYLRWRASNVTQPDLQGAGYGLLDLPTVQ